jgi:hypothetical protein
MARRLPYLLFGRAHSSLGRRIDLLTRLRQQGHEGDWHPYVKVQANSPIEAAESLDGGHLETSTDSKQAFFIALDYNFLRHNRLRTGRHRDDD